MSGAVILAPRPGPPGAPVTAKEKLGRNAMSDNVYPVPDSWRGKAWIDAKKYEDMYQRSVKDPAGFWADQAKHIDWITAPTKIKDSSFTGDVHIKWFEDGVLNASLNCLDRHLAKRGGQTAILWEGDDPKD